MTVTSYLIILGSGKLLLLKFDAFNVSKFDVLY